MLQRWGEEVSQGGSRPNILALLMEQRGGDGELLPPMGAMFTPLAEKTDWILWDIQKMDRTLYEVLVAIALKYSVTDVSRMTGWSRSKAQLEMDNGLAAFAMAVWYRSKVRRWGKAVTA